MISCDISKCHCILWCHHCILGSAFSTYLRLESYDRTQNNFCKNTDAALAVYTVSSSSSNLEQAEYIKPKIQWRHLAGLTIYHLWGQLTTNRSAGIGSWRIRPTLTFILAICGCCQSVGSVHSWCWLDLLVVFLVGITVWQTGLALATNRSEDFFN